MSLTDHIETEAHRLGFQLVGVTTPDPPPHSGVYEFWLETKRHGEMSYLASDRARQRRANPRRILPECQAILVLGIPYHAPESVPRPENSGLTGRISSYAWSNDYHEVVIERLKELVSYIEDQVGKSIPNRCYTDTGPVLERDLAQRAGLGWIGKNTCLINPQLGSYFFLAEVLLGIKLDVDLPFVDDRCGSCTRCMEACPTNCILPNRTLDASRCISYLTIELKGAIPPDVRPLIGDWVFGCDVCQQVCPWNHRSRVSEGDPAFAPRTGIPHPNLVEELQLTPLAFNQKFKGNPLKRTKRRGYLRNAAITLGNIATSQGAVVAEKVVETLMMSLQNDPEPLVRAHAAWALGEIWNEEARRALVNAEKSEVDEEVLSEIQAARAV